ncbi:hypothetical protein PR048_031649 [Dryococelus australis]|uniref:Chromo domain-containing protein n=1 Tax=Dryococelus australis TaxID=614101 RepID=A0ABQ9G5V8_9NEOP|nr:hypothetical protein PR048_031649 [Dryococelus australis]
MLGLLVPPGYHGLKSRISGLLVPPGSRDSKSRISGSLVPPGSHSLRFLVVCVDLRQHSCDEVCDVREQLVSHRRIRLPHASRDLLSCVTLFLYSEGNRFREEGIINKLYKPVQKKIQRRKVISYSIDDLWQIDLVEMDTGYTANWSTELFTICKVLNFYIATKKLKYTKEELIMDSFYDYEILKTNYPDKYLVERVLKTKGNKIYVKWLGYYVSNNSWINKTDVVEPQSVILQHGPTAYTIRKGRRMVRVHRDDIWLTPDALDEEVSRGTSRPHDGEGRDKHMQGQGQKLGVAAIHAGDPAEYLIVRADTGIPTEVVQNEKASLIINCMLPTHRLPFSKHLPDHLSGVTINRGDVISEDIRSGWTAHNPKISRVNNHLDIVSMAPGTCRIENDESPERRRDADVSLNVHDSTNMVVDTRPYDWSLLWPNITPTMIYLVLHWLLAVVSCTSGLCDSGMTVLQESSSGERAHRIGPQWPSGYSDLKWGCSGYSDLKWGRSVQWLERYYTGGNRSWGFTLHTFSPLAIDLLLPWEELPRPKRTGCMSKHMLKFPDEVVGSRSGCASVSEYIPKFQDEVKMCERAHAEVPVAVGSRTLPRIVAANHKLPQNTEQGKQENPEKTCQPAASSEMIPKGKNPGATTPARNRNPFPDMGTINDVFRADDDGMRWIWNSAIKQGSGKHKSSRKPASQLHHPVRFLNAKSQEYSTNEISKRTPSMKHARHVGDPLNQQTQLVEHVARVRVATGRVPQSEEVIVNEGRQQTSSTSANKSALTLKRNSAEDYKSKVMNLHENMYSLPLATQHSYKLQQKGGAHVWWSKQVNLRSEIASVSDGSFKGRTAWCQNLQQLNVNRRQTLLQNESCKWLPLFKCYHQTLGIVSKQPINAEQSKQSVNTGQLKLTLILIDNPQPGQSCTITIIAGNI